jgi:hypothetical protein
LYNGFKVDYKLGCDFENDSNFGGENKVDERLDCNIRSFLALFDIFNGVLDYFHNINFIIISYSQINSNDHSSKTDKFGHPRL